MTKHHQMSDMKPPGVRERILNAAAQILAEEGVQHLSQVQAARRAGVRQSHLTYYFPTREDLLAAVTEKMIGGIEESLRKTLSDGGGSERSLLERLAASVADTAHMRSFLAMIIESDGDPAIRKFMRLGTQQMETAVAKAIGKENKNEDARNILIAVWGLGLYHFLIRPAAKAKVTDKYLSWLGPVGGQKP